MEVKIIGKMDNAIDHTFESANRVYDKDGLYPTISTCAGGGIQPKIIEKTKCVGGLAEDNGGLQFHQQDSCKYIVAMRGRGENNKQRLEPNKSGTTNSLTTVQKDNLVMEENGFYKQALETAEKGNAKPGDIIDAFNGKVNKSGVSPTITTRPEEKKTAILPCVGKYRIRKLTPRECWRLMGYSDEDFEKAQAVNSNTQLYKQAGNAIVKQVLMAIFSQMNIKGVTPWNKRK